jgi:sulfide:quinone oxidoreductase
LSDKSIHVLILGAGFGGLAAANELRSNTSSNVKITVIDKKDWFMMDLVKLWIIKGTRKFETSKRPLNSITRKGIEFLNEDVIKIEPQKQMVITSARKISYDYLIISLGVELAPEKIPGLLDNGLILYDINDVPKIHEKIKHLKSGKLAFAIMGMPYKCPPAPFEAAFIINTMLKEAGIRNSVQIDFYSPVQLTLPAAGPEVSQQLLELLNSENITFYGLHKTTRVEPNKLRFENSEKDFDLLIAIPPHKAPKSVYDSRLAKEGEFINVNRDCKTMFDNAYAIGDVTNMTVTNSIVVPKAGIFAEEQGITVARNIIAKIKHKKENAIFNGKGGCFVELGTNQAGYIEVDMFSQSTPLTLLKHPTTEHMKEKEKFESDRLDKWL